jgi:hypothetical protein
LQFTGVGDREEGHHPGGESFGSGNIGGLALLLTFVYYRC